MLSATTLFVMDNDKNKPKKKKKSEKCSTLKKNTYQRLVAVSCSNKYTSSVAELWCSSAHELHQPLYRPTYSSYHSEVKLKSSRICFGFSNIVFDFGQG